MGQWERAAGLFGAAAALRDALQVPLAPGERGQYERSLTGARAQADPVRWQAAWAAGRAQPLAQTWSPQRWWRRPLPRRSPPRLPHDVVLPK